MTRIQLSPRTRAIAVCLFCVCILVPMNMGGCATDAVQGVGQVGSLTGKPVPLPAGSSQYAQAAEKAVNAWTLGEAEEDGMGQAVAVAVTNKYPLVNDPELTRYVTLVGLTVASATSRPDGNYVFGVVESADVNAFAGPNGYIMVTRGALSQMHDEAELAGVLAHEIAHVVNHDGLNAVRQAGMVDAGTTAAKAADSRVNMFGKWTDATIDVVLKKGYSKDQELSADRAAVRFVTLAGYDPHSYLSFIKRQSSAGAGSPMSTHPGLSQRVGAIQSQIGATTGGATLKARFDKSVKR
ncbi:MAG: M48 family metalloprotease [Tepidisphaeraceae bacterium]